MKYLISTVVLFSIACTNPPTVPTVIAAPQKQLEMSYAINVPSFAIQQALIAQNGESVKAAPLDAQRRWDYTAAYGGTPNVYYGEQSPPCQSYLGVGIVIAPRGVAGVPTFTAADWPNAHLDADTVYTWVGRFAVARVPLPSEYVFGRC